MNVRRAQKPIYPILVHFLFNFLLTLVEIDLIQLFIYTAIFNAQAICLIFFAKQVKWVKAWKPVS